MGDISKITLPSGNTYDLKDAGARALINNLSSATSFLGVTTTALTDGSETTTIVVNTKNVAAASGCVAIYGTAEFIFDGTKWHEFGDLSTLGSLAKKNSATGSVTAAGSVSQPTFTGSAVSYTPEGTIKMNSYTPAGKVSAPTITPDVTTTTVNSITSVGTLPSCTLPTMTTSVSGETLTLSWSAGSFSAGTLPVKGANTTVATGVTATASAPTFTGTAAAPSGTFTGTAKNITATGTVSKPTFTGSAVSVTVS